MEPFTLAKKKVSIYKSGSTLRMTERQIFDFNRTDHGIGISNLELLPPTWGALYIGVFEPSLVDIDGNDNEVATHGINTGKSTNFKNLECLMIQAVYQMVTGKRKRAIRVRTEDNFLADPGSRKDQQAKFRTELDKWEARTGRKARKIQRPPKARDLSRWELESDGEDIRRRADSAFSKLLE